ncbi:hypothetical protein DV738_g2640, partial [Chaetothyriales sp. CBS 135597]
MNPPNPVAGEQCNFDLLSQYLTAAGAEVKKAQNLPAIQEGQGILIQMQRMDQRMQQMDQRMQQMDQHSILPIPCDDESRLLFVRIKTELAFCEYPHLDGNSTIVKAGQCFTDAIQSSIDLLGQISWETIELRARFATALARCALYSDALNVLDGLHADCEAVSHPWSHHVKQLEDGCRAVKEQTRSSKPYPRSRHAEYEEKLRAELRRRRMLKC